MNADKLAQLRELFETWLASRPSFRTTVEVQAAWEGWKANTAVAAMLVEYAAPPAPKIEATPDFVHSVLEHYPLDESGHFRTLSPVRLAVALEAALKETP